MSKVKNEPKYKNAALQAIRAQFARCSIIKVIATNKEVK